MKNILFLFVLLLPLFVNAGNVILMIGDGMGKNHLKCAEKLKTLYMSSLPIKGTVITRSASSRVTDSAASATAYACGQKTKNRYLGKLPSGEDCLTIAEESVQKGISVGIYSTDYASGATPSAFYAHVFDRNDKSQIEKYKQSASQNMDIIVPVEKLSDEVRNRLEKLSNTSNNNRFFVLFEGGKIDTASHDNKLEEMKQELYDFDLAVKYAVNFIQRDKNTTLIVLADHETGGLGTDCKFTQSGHTDADVPLFAYGKYADLFKGKQDNTEIYKKIHKILFDK